MTEILIILEQSKSIAIANMKARYRKTFAGFVWVILNPLIMFTIQNLLFSRVLNTKIENYSIFLMGGLIPWMFCAQCIDMTISIFSTNSSHLKLLQVNPLVIILGQIIDNSINFIIILVILYIFSVLYLGNSGFDSGLLTLPLSVLVMTFGVFAISFILAIINVFFRDTRYLVNVIINLMFFLTPIFYSESLVPQEIKWISKLNIIYLLIIPIRRSIYKFNYISYLKELSVSVILCITLLFIANRSWRNLKHKIYLKI